MTLDTLAAARGQRCTVHFNLHKRLWSVTHRGKVIAHLPGPIVLHDARPSFSPALHRKVIENNCRKVYLKVSGILPAVDPEPYQTIEVHANPYRSGGVFTLADGRPWTGGVATTALFPVDPADPTKAAGFFMV